MKLILREILINIESERENLSFFLQKHQLKYEDIEYAVGLYEIEKLVACGCCSGPILKCFAIEEDFRGFNLLGQIVTALISNRFANGYFNLVVITRPINIDMFLKSSFYLVAQTGDLVFLENIPDGVDRYVAEIKSDIYVAKTVGAIVVNCNPFTLGHRYLIEYASSRCDLLHVFVVQEDKSLFPFDIRYQLVLQGVADLPKVKVHKGGIYIVSSATFPSYFLKEKEDVVEIQANLDATIFATRIAPQLSISRRYVGTEPYCYVTGKYNEAMKDILPLSGIEVIEIPRKKTNNGEIISASRVRSLLQKDYQDDDLLKLVPETTLSYLKSDNAAPIIARLKIK